MTGTTYDLPVMDTVKTAWSKVSGAKGSFWAVLGVLFVIEFVIGFFGGFFQAPNGQMPLAVTIVSLLFGIVVMVISWGLLYLGIQRAAGQPITYRMVGYAFNWGLIFRMIGLYILQIVMLGGVSLILLLTTVLSMGAVVNVILGIVWFVLFYAILFRLILGKAFVIAKQLGPVDAIKASFAATKGNVWNVIAIMIIALLILFVSAIPFGIGLIWSLPYVFINYGEMFKKLVTTR
jgi:hypothetical protein